MRLLFTLLSIACSLSLFAQHTYTGCVIDERGEPLIGVSIRNGTVGTVTNLKGCFSLEASGDSVLLKVSYTGYIDQTVTALRGEPLNIRMKVETELMEEVVVIGYGATRRMDRLSLIHI